MRQLILSILLCSFCLQPAYSQENPDFYIVGDRCQTTVGYNRIADGNLYTEEGERSVMSCVRHSSDLICDLKFENGENSIGEKYRISIESGPYLHFISENNAEYYQVNKNNNTVAFSSRSINIDMVISKLCVGYYLTKTEFDMLQNDNKE